MHSMTSEMYEDDARASKRIDLVFPIMLNGYNGETKNISSTGVYFEVITNDMEIFSPGRTISFQINASAATPGFVPRDIKLNGNGSVVRNELKRISRHGNKLGVAIEFKEKLDLRVV